MGMDLQNITAMMEALCKAEGLDASSITGDIEGISRDNSLSPSIMHMALEMSLDLDVVTEDI
jgi:hypothetical protein